MGKAVGIRVMSSMIPTYVNDKVDIRHFIHIKNFARYIALRIG